MMFLMGVRKKICEQKTDDRTVGNNGPAACGGKCLMRKRSGILCVVCVYIRMVGGCMAS
jgi:hypothetical protein